MSEQTPRLSALVVVRNEEAQLAACLVGLTFADECVVVLDRCTDRSRAIALECGARVIEGSWPIEGHRRAAGQEACAGRWVLEIDADERVSPELAGEIIDTLALRESLGEGPDWWRIPFHNYLGTRLVRYGWGAHFGVRARATLYRRGVKSWGGQRVHPKVRLSGKEGPDLSNPIAHFAGRDVSDLIQRLDRYSTARALDLYDGAGQPGSFAHNVGRIFARVWKCYVLRKGYREGALGLVLALCAGFYPFLSFVKFQELGRK